jgi:hypothetical protein
MKTDAVYSLKEADAAMAAAVTAPGVATVEPSRGLPIAPPRRGQED